MVKIRVKGGWYEVSNSIKDIQRRINKGKKYIKVTDEWNNKNKFFIKTKKSLGLV